jgi:hypothetical protein
MALGQHSGAYHEGDHAVICDICGFRYRRSEMRYNWKHQLVCISKCFETRNPQDYAIHPKGDIQSVPDPRPRTAPVFVDIAAPPDYNSLPATCGTGPNTVQSS